MVLDEAKRLLETRQRILAIGKCRVRLGCEFDTAHEIIRLIERKTPRADVIVAMEKAAVGVPIARMQTSDPDNLPAPNERAPQPWFVVKMLVWGVG